MTEIVDSEMDFVSIFRQAERRVKNSSVAKQDIETLSGGENVFCGVSDGCKGSKIALEEGHLHKVSITS
jgi:hypothetical protein